MDVYKVLHPVTNESLEVSRADFEAFRQGDFAYQVSAFMRLKGMPAADKTPEPPVAEPEYTGGSSSYYLVYVANPTTPGMPAYTAECNDIIEALQMNYAEGNAFKALWRRRAAELGKQKKGYDNGLYDAEKIVFFGERLVVQSKAAKETPNV